MTVADTADVRAVHANSVTVPNFVVIPVKDHLALTRSVICQLQAQGDRRTIVVFDNGSGCDTARWLHAQGERGALVVVHAAQQTLYEMWNHGVDIARERCPDANIAFLNNDLVIGPRFLHHLAAALRADPDLWAVSANYDRRHIRGVQYVTSTFKRGGLAGFAFMVRGAAFDTIRFDETFRWWYGDDDLVAQIQTHGRRVGIAAAAHVEHVNGGSQTVRYTTDVIAVIDRDRQRMLQKWGHD